MKGKLCFILSIIIIMVSSDLVYGSGMSISSVSRLNLSRGVIIGENAQYTMIIPQLWQGYLIADRENVSDESTVIEKLTFYYQPYRKVTKPVFLTELCIHDNSENPDYKEYRKLMETQKYIFTVKGATENVFTGETDKAIFKIFLNNINDDDYLKDLILLARDDERIPEFSITVNGVLLNGTVIREQSTAYLPLREVCQALGYKVGWLNKEKAVTIAKGTEYYGLLTLKESSANLGYNIVMKNEKAYVSSIFFIQQLKYNVEVDDRYNVFIYR